MSVFSDLHGRAEERGDKDVFLDGKSYLAFCEYWLGYAKKSGEMRALDYVASLVHSVQLSSSQHSSSTDVPRPDPSPMQVDEPAPSVPSRSRPVSPHKRSQSTMVVSLAKICTSFVQGTAFFEGLATFDGSETELKTRFNEISSAAQAFKLILPPQDSEDDDRPRAYSKTRRAQERLRRAVVRYLGTPSLSSDRTKPTRAFLTELVSGMEHMLNALYQESTSDDFTAVLDTLFLLARTTLVPSDPVSNDSAYAFLSRACAILGLELDNAHEYKSEINRPTNVPEDVYANYIRCVSGAFHNLAGALYQADRYGYATRFLRHGCVLGSLALRLGRACGLFVGDVEDQSSAKQMEAWRQLEDQLTRRWELLGVCYSKIGDRKLAYEAFALCIASYAFPRSVGESIRTAGPSQVFSSSSSLKQLAVIIDRVTYMAACELGRDPTEVSLKRMVGDITLEDEHDRLCVGGAILERQLQSLEGSQWKESVEKVVLALLFDLLSLYDPKTRPMRRAAVVLKCLEFTYYSAKAEGCMRGYVALHWSELAEEIESLLATQKYGEDAQLARFQPHYQAISHLWLALHAHRRQDPSQSDVAIKHVQKACRILKPLVAASGAPPSPTAVRKSPIAPKKGKGRTVPTRPAKTPARRPPPKTPRKASAAKQPLGTYNLPSRFRQTDGHDFYDFRHLFDLLRMNIDLMGFLGHVLAKVQLLHITRYLCERHTPHAHDEYMVSSIDLAYEYLKLGKLRKAGSIFNRTLALFRSGVSSDESRILFLLRHTESLAVMGDVQQSTNMYSEAAALSDTLLNDDKDLSTTDRIRSRVGRLERAALAASVFAEVQLTKDEPTAALTCLLQSLRLWNRAISTLARLTTPPASTPEESNPFQTSGAASPTKESISVIPDSGSVRPKATFKGLEWQVSMGLLSTLLSLSQLYFARGSAREAEYFAQQAEELAESLNAPAMLGCALARKGEIQLHLGQLEQAYQSLAKASEALDEVVGPEMADVQRLFADYHARSMKEGDAQQMYVEAAALLEDLGKRLSSVDGLGLRHNAIYAQASDMLAPKLLSSVLRRHIWLLRDDLGDEYQTLLKKLSDLPPSADMKAEEYSLIARLTLHDAFDHLREDIFLGSVSDSVITLPMGISGEKTSATATSQEIGRLLSEADSLFWSNLAAIARRGKVNDVRDAAVSLAYVRSLQTSLGRDNADGPVLVANLLDASVAITLQREMLEVIQNKFPAFAAMDDLRWPSSDPPTLHPKRRLPVTSRADSPFGSSDSDDEPDVEASSLREYWEAVRTKYASQVFGSSDLSSSRVDSLPENWTVIHICLTEDKNSMFVARQRAGQSPLVFCVPLKESRREGEGEEHLTVQDAINEMKEIVRLNDETTKQAVHVKTQDKDARAAWWAERMALDNRLQELLENIEFCWLGAFKTILSEPADVPLDVVADLRTRLDKVFKRGLGAQEKKLKSKIHLDDTLLKCFSTLPPKCRDEELEDLVYFILDIYQLHGTAVAISEVDVDHVVVDLRNALEEHRAKTKARVVPQKDSHTFLILDKNIQGLPWESIPILRGRSVSRIPSLQFLIDRLDMVKWKHRTSTPATNVSSPIDRAHIDASNAFYVLNPSGDLTATEKPFSGWLKRMDAVGWEGLVGKVPSEQQMVDALSKKDLFIYFGHGGAEQYVRSHKVRHLPQCAATMLWGCSSGLLKEMGEFDRMGTPYSYMLGGCPTLVANLWDVTDRDIDKFSQAVFDKMDLTPESVRRQAQNPRRLGGTSIVEAVAQSRNACKLKYLTGASPIIYGIPFYL
ncbi:peptidase family C50-domain-containing protein [Amylostereum chailletii]|nr:peptidase family C50-domain-containing protein [Amylostereum chailletii]